MISFLFFFKKSRQVDGFCINVTYHILNMFMFFGLDNFLLSILLVLNGIVILNEQRCLAKIGCTKQQITNLNQHSFDPASSSLSTSFKYKIVNLIFSLKMVCKIPLLVINLLVIVFELIFG